MTVSVVVVGDEIDWPWPNDDGNIDGEDEGRMEAPLELTDKEWKSLKKREQNVSLWNKVKLNYRKMGSANDRL